MTKHQTNQREIKSNKQALPWLALSFVIFILAIMTIIGLNQQNIKKQDITAPKIAIKKKPTRRPNKVKVIINGLRLRATPEVSNNLIGSLNGGTELTVLEERGGWFKVRAPNGLEGYVSSRTDYLERLNP